jgi:hypothetical protein
MNNSGPSEEVALSLPVEAQGPLVDKPVRSVQRSRALVSLLALLLVASYQYLYVSTELDILRLPALIVFVVSH